MSRSDPGEGASAYRESLAPSWRALRAPTLSPSGKGSPPSSRPRPRLDLAPHLAGNLDDHAQLGPLLLLGQHVAFLAGGKAALRAQAQLVEVDESCRLVD